MKLLIFAGNGFSISLTKGSSNQIDLLNLFSHGCEVLWPSDQSPGFLSHEYCPNLWALGARPNMGAEASYGLIEKIITAINACCLANSEITQNIYTKAYKELVTYLRHLFVHYDNKLLSSKFYSSKDALQNAAWIIDAEASGKYDSIDIINLSYDIFLERILTAARVNYNVVPFDTNRSVIKIYKPHGSISFCGKTILDISSFSINYQTTFTEGKAEDFRIKYHDLGEHFSNTGLLPPAGDSERYKHKWSAEIWKPALECASNITKNDKVIFYGISYWHVDRNEIDQILGRIPRNSKLISVNPSPNENFEAVCCTLFDSYHSQPNSSQLGKLLT